MRFSSFTCAHSCEQPELTGDMLKEFVEAREAYREELQVKQSLARHDGYTPGIVSSVVDTPAGAQDEVFLIARHKEYLKLSVAPHPPLYKNIA